MPNKALFNRRFWAFFHEELHEQKLRAGGEKDFLSHSYLRQVEKNCRKREKSFTFYFTVNSRVPKVEEASVDTFHFTSL